MINRRHIRHLLPGYVHHQLNQRDRDRVVRHLDTCIDCRVALAREQLTARDLKQGMPRIGRPEAGQLRRLWPRVWADFRKMPPVVQWLPSLSVIVMMVLVFTIGLSSLFGGSVPAIAAPNPLVPADIKATSTPVRTEEARGDDDAMTNAGVAASQTASPLLSAPQPSPAPPPVSAIMLMRAP